jgi:hypothetical protein
MVFQPYYGYVCFQPYHGIFCHIMVESTQWLITGFPDTLLDNFQKGCEPLWTFTKTMLFSQLIEKKSFQSTYVVQDSRQVLTSWS